MPLSLTHSIFALCALAAVAVAAVSVALGLRSGDADTGSAEERSKRSTEIVWAFVPVLILGLVLASILQGGNG